MTVARHPSITEPINSVIYTLSLIVPYTGRRALPIMADSFIFLVLSRALVLPR